MQILLCAATEREITPSIQALPQTKEHKIRFMVTGVGLMACTYALTKEVLTNRPDFILQAGVAGSLIAEQPLATVVAVQSECVGDLGVNENGKFLSLFDMGLSAFDAVPWQNGRLKNSHDFLRNCGLPAVDGVSVNQITTAQETINHYRDKLKVQVESMEGAALHYIAIQEGIPFLQIRSLSNFIGERNKSRWQLKEAIENLNEEVLRLVAKLETA